MPLRQVISETSAVRRYKAGRWELSQDCQMRGLYHFQISDRGWYVSIPDGEQNHLWTLENAQRAAVCPGEQFVVADGDDIQGGRYVSRRIL